jgi:hypothetical protein
LLLFSFYCLEVYWCQGSPHRPLLLMWAIIFHIHRAMVIQFK